MHRAFRISPSWKYFIEECERLKQLFRRLRYPQTLVDNTIAKFIAKKCEQSNPAPVDETRKQSILRIVLPFKDQKSANIARWQLNDLGTRVGIIFQPVYVSKKLESALHVPEKKPPLVNQQGVVYKFKCTCDLCDADYVGYTCRHLHERIDEHNNSVVGKHARECDREEPARIEHCFSILKKCQSKFDCLLYEMLFIRELKPKLNTQSCSLKSKLFT